MSWYVENAEDVVGRPAKERPKQRKGKPTTKYGQRAFESWSSLLSRKGDSLQRALGVRIGRILGCGHYGCTTESSAKKVIKLSPLPGDDSWDDDEELKFWTKMKSEQRRPKSPASEGVVKVDHVWVVTDEQTDEKYMVVLRDAVEPFVSVVPDPSAPAMITLVPTPTTAGLGVTSIPTNRPDDLTEELKYRDGASARAIRTLENLLDPVLRATNEYRLGDVHLGNIGWHGGALVIYDADYKLDAPGPDKQLRVNRARQELTPGMPAWQVTFDEWSEMLERKGDSLESALGAPVGNIIGCGAFGCVVESAPGQVIKLTSARQHGGDLDYELAFWTHMKKEQKRPQSPASKGVARIDKVASITDKDTGEQYIAVLREDVAPVLNTETWTPTAATVSRGLSLENLDESPAVSGAVEAMQEYNLNDVHPGNLGWSGDKVVIFDAHLSAKPLKEDARMRVNDRYSPFHEQLPGGLASGMRPEDFEPEQLARGIEVELEHTQDVALATEIAMDHLVEDPEYYTKLGSLHLNPSRRTVAAPKTPPKEQRELLVDREGTEWIVIPGSPFLEADGERYTRDWVEQRLGPLRPVQMIENARAFYVFEMDGDEPLRMANRKPLTKKQAQQFARIGAQRGKHDRAVTTDPRKDDFRIVERYEAGTGSALTSNPDPVEQDRADRLSRLSQRLKAQLAADKNEDAKENLLSMEYEIGELKRSVFGWGKRGAKETDDVRARCSSLKGKP